MSNAYLILVIFTTTLVGQSDTSPNLWVCVFEFGVGFKILEFLNKLKKKKTTNNNNYYRYKDLPLLVISTHRKRLIQFFFFLEKKKTNWKFKTLPNYFIDS